MDLTTTSTSHDIFHDTLPVERSLDGAEQGPPFMQYI